MTSHQEALHHESIRWTFRLHLPSKGRDGAVIHCAQLFHLSIQQILRIVEGKETDA